MSYALLETSLKVENLIAVNMTKLTLKDSLNHLLNGDVIVISHYEQENAQDVFSRLNLALNIPITEISYTSPDDSPVWQNYPIPVNAFALYDCYTYDPALYGNQLCYVGDVIKYNKNGAQVGIISGVYKDAQNIIYYTLKGDDTVYSIVKIVVQPSTSDNISGITSVLQPVADPTQDYHQVPVSDYENKIYALI